MSELKLDTKDFDAKFKALIKDAVPDDLRNGLYQAAIALLNYADKEDPQTPYKEGDLRGSRSPAGNESPGSLVKNVGIAGLMIQAGFNSVYAARLHEGEKNWNWTRDRVANPGPKFLESKLWAHDRDLKEVMAFYLARRLGGHNG